MHIFTFLTFASLLLLAQAARIVRFISDDGQEYTGDAILPGNTIDASKSTSARIIEGDVLGNFTVTDNIKNITQLLSPISPERIRTVRCAGFNYVAHAQQSGHAIPDFPILFFKPWTALSDPGVIVPITPGYQNQTNFTSEMDYEAELVVVIKKRAFNISEDEALDHVLGYSVGNDVSHRGWQIARGGEPEPQYSMGKDADGWAPWGPALVTTDVIPDPQTLQLTSRVNGALKQNATTADMIFGVKQLVSFFSMGITLLPGDIIFTGTPEGVQFGMDNPVWLTDGDVVEVELSEIGTVTNTYTFTDGTSSIFQF
ncbi:fumarylacetoacetate hydrolase domain-containing protein 2a [Moniliophthora roreri MCA 2997]|uniref:Fumarylacetoacetate hydrolase domain-containing protein 2a n=2 Tax=Moniliophthora roreri TaxID=221103 RepID=V2X1Q4_MONRO|nr:fumarylacetoacetate hydrolase domain-containing protein 2a [Moniliophthora roreri MCA 2997]